MVIAKESQDWYSHTCMNITKFTKLRSMESMWMGWSGDVGMHYISLGTTRELVPVIHSQSNSLVFSDKLTYSQNPTWPIPREAVLQARQDNVSEGQAFSFLFDRQGSLRSSHSAGL